MALINGVYGRALGYLYCTIRWHSSKPTKIPRDHTPDTEGQQLWLVINNRNLISKSHGQVDFKS